MSPVKCCGSAVVQRSDNGQTWNAQTAPGADLVLGLCTQRHACTRKKPTEESQANHLKQSCSIERENLIVPSRPTGDMVAGPV